jgi:hypothetical protein
MPVPENPSPAPKYWGVVVRVQLEEEIEPGARPPTYEVVRYEELALPEAKAI